MLLFKPEHVQPILDGRKTETRRRGKCRWRVGAVHQAQTRLFGEPFARLRIVAVYQQTLGAMPESCARREGYPSLAAYRQVWERINRCQWDPDEMVWAIRFEREENSHVRA